MDYQLSNESAIHIVSQSQFYSNYYINSFDTHDNYSSESDYTSIHQLNEGVNLVSFRILPQDNSISNIFSSSSINGVIGQGTAAIQLGSGDWVGGLTEVECSNGYWVKTSEMGLYGFAGERMMNCEYNLQPGNNLVGFDCDSAIPIEIAISSNCITSIIGQGSAALLSDNGWIGSLTELEPGKGYWIRSECLEEVLLDYNCSIESNIQN